MLWLMEKTYLKLNKSGRKYYKNSIGQGDDYHTFLLPQPLSAEWKDFEKTLPRYE